MKKTIVFLLLLLLGADMLFAQTRKVTGSVVSADDGKPIIGATVLVKGTSIGGTTDVDGNFVLQNVPASAKMLRITFIGMEQLEVEIMPVLKVQLKADNKLIDEVVVTGMQKTDKRLFTGAATKLSAENVKINGMPEISRALEGRAAGVSVQNVSGTFGSAPKIRVRGATSIYGSSKPLWVVDGVVMEDVIEVSADALSSGDATTLISSAIAGLNSDDIESFQILKDGSATSIYGARAMAGVIVVTTKKGKAGQSSINYTGEFTLRMKPSYSNFNIMNSQDQMSIYQEMAQKGWLNYASVPNSSNYGVYGDMYSLIKTYDTATGQFGLENTPEARAAYLRGAEMRNTDWFKSLFETNLMQTHSVSISAGTEKSSYYASISAPKYNLQHI
jgi:TonB-dependent SusC/RagA subfamily outer membrane receptor